MAHEFSGSAEIDRPIGEVFAFLADGTNDPKFHLERKAPLMRLLQNPRPSCGFWCRTTIA